MSEKLEKARLYEIEEAKISRRKRNRPFHVSAPVGWINDPNGLFCFLKERYIFFTSIILTAVTGALCTGATV